MTAHELFRRLRLKTLRLRKSAMNRTTSSRSRLRILPLEDRLAPAATTFVNDNWNLVTDNGTIGVVDSGDILNNANDTINPGGVVVAYGIDGFGIVTTGSATGSAAGAATINDAITNTTVGGTANVLEGNYNEQVALNSSISLWVPGQALMPGADGC
jgi:hypothetical protein